MVEPIVLKGKTLRANSNIIAYRKPEQGPYHRLSLAYCIEGGVLPRITKFVPLTELPAKPFIFDSSPDRSYGCTLAQLIEHILLDHEDFTRFDLELMHYRKFDASDLVASIYPLLE